MNGINSSLNTVLKDDRINTTDKHLRSTSNDIDTINKIILQLSDDSKPINERMETFIQYCNLFTFLLSEEQADFLINLLSHAIELNDQTLISYFLHAIDIIIHFGEEFNDDFFIQKERLDVIISCFPNPNAFSIASYFVSLNLEYAKIIWEYDNIIHFNTLVYQPDKTLPTPVSPDQALSFLSSFLYYSEFIENMLEIIESSLQLWIVSDSDSGIRFEILRFIYYSIKLRNEIANSLINNHIFYTLFQSPSESPQHKDLILIILRELCFQTKNPERVIIQSNLLPFIEVTINSDDNNFICYCSDIIGDIAENSNAECFDTLIRDGLLDALWNILENNAIQCQICANSSLLRFFHNGNDDVKTELLQRGLFSHFADLLPYLSEKHAKGDLIFFLEILSKLESEEKQSFIDAIFNNEELIEALNELDDENSDENLGILVRSILSRIEST